MNSCCCCENTVFKIYCILTIIKITCFSVKIIFVELSPYNIFELSFIGLMKNSCSPMVLTHLLLIKYEPISERL